MPYSCLPQEIRNKLNEYTCAYNKAERAIKLFELTSSEGLIFPAVNELRCAGQHISRAFLATTTEESAVCIDHAIRHARRSQYDAYDAGINYFIDLCKCFQEDYKKETISEINPVFTDEKITIERLIKELSQEDRSQSENYSDQKERQFSTAQQIAEKWDSSREELNKKIKLRRKAEKIQVWILLLAIIGLCISTVSCFYASRQEVNSSNVQKELPQKP